MRKSFPLWLVVFFLASVSARTAVEAQTSDLLLGFNDAAGPASAQNDYVIDLGLNGSNLLSNAKANGGSTNLAGIISATTFKTAFNSDANDLIDVAAGIVGGITSQNPKQLYMTSPAAPISYTSQQVFNSSISAATSPTTGEYPSASTLATANWSQIIAASPTAVGTEAAGQSLASDSGNPMGLLSSGTLSLNLYENTETVSGVHETVNGWVQVGVFSINVNTLAVSFSLASASPPPAISSVGSAITNGFSPLKVVFTNSASGSITNWVWNFGNGTIITNTTDASVTNTYTTGGDYTVTLTVYGSGGSSTVTLASYIVASPTPKIAAALSTGNFVLSGTNCPVGVQYRIFSSTNLALPFADWKPVVTNTFTSNGTFSFTNSTTNPAAFYQLISP